MIPTKEEIPQRLASIERMVKKLLSANHSEIAVKTALMKFECKGDNAAWMRTAEVSIVLGIGRNGVQKLVQRGELTQRYPVGCFHPDDVRAFIKAREEKQNVA